MYRITVTLNSDPFEQYALHVLTPEHPAGFTADDVFRACNRVSDYADDLVSLPHEWQHELRRNLDAKRAPSMSVGDRYQVYDVDNDAVLVDGVCKPFGWLHTVDVYAGVR